MREAIEQLEILKIMIDSCMWRRNYMKKFKLWRLINVLCTLLIIYLVTSGRASYLLRRSAKLNTERKKAKEYELMIEDFNKEKEEKKEDDMN